MVYHDQFVQVFGINIFQHIFNLQYCYSDFPMPKGEFSMVMASRNRIRRLSSAHKDGGVLGGLYCKQFDIKRHIKFRHEIIRAEQYGNHWQITTKSSQGINSWVFDKVLFANGRYQIPLWSKVDDLQRFQGELMHASKYAQIIP